MSTITVTNIKATGETASRAVSGVAAAYCNGAATGTVNDGQSFNISTVVDVGTGDIDFILTNAVTSTSTTCVTSAGSGSARVGQSNTGWSNTSTFLYQCFSSSAGTAADAGQNYMAVFGDLA